MKTNVTDRQQAGSDFLLLIERLSLATSIAKLGFWDYDPTSNAFTWDATMCQIYGFASSAPIPYEKWSSAVWPEDLPSTEATLQRVMREKNLGTVVEFRITRADGALRNVSAVGKAVLDERGNVARIIGVNIDITARKQAEARLLENEERFRILVEGVQDYAIFTLDPIGKVVSWNAGAQRIKGYKAEEIIGQNFSRFYLQKDIDLGKPKEELQVAATSGRSEIEHWRVRKDGSHFWANVVITAARDPSGCLLGFSEISRDISERKETEAKYRGLLEAAPDAMVVVNAAGEIVLLNVQVEKQFGYHRDELLGQKVTNIIPEGFAERLIADGTRTAAEALAQQIGTGIELIARRKDGSVFPIEIMLSPLESSGGILVTAAIRDISVRNAAAKHLAQMESRYRGLLEAAPDAMVVVNAAGEIVLLNAQAEKQFGYRRDELLGQKVKNIIPEGFAERLIADGTRTAAAALAQQIGTGIELTARRKDGSDFPIEIMLSPLENAEGILVTAAIRDITEKKLAQEGIQQQQHLLQLIIESIADGVVVADCNGKFLLFNSAAKRCLGIGAVDAAPDQWSEQYGTYFPDAVTPYPSGDLPLVRALRGENVDSTEVFVRNAAVPDGRWLYIIGGPLRDESGALRGGVVVLHDITEHKKADKQLLKTVAELKRSNDELQQFASVASHDLQEPLRMVASYTQLLAKRYKGRLDADADEFIGYAVDGSNRMQGLIQDLLAYSRAGTNGKALHEISSETALQEALSNLRATMEESGALVTHDALPAITTDVTQLAQVFQNLVGNAIKYRSAEIPHIHVSAEKTDGKEWIFSVRDNGLGIDPQYFERIFILFQRLHGQTEFKGSGIGLTICKKIVERLGGRIWVASQPGVGSTFFFALPERASK
jgi:PAS domain S-box-containing protein